MKKKYIIIAVLILIVVGAVISRIYQQKNLIYLKPKKGDIQEAIYGLGTVKSEKIYEVKAGVMTNITQQYVREGDMVKKGDKLILLETDALFKAPFAGTVTSVQFNQGEIALPQVTIMRLEDIQDKYIEVTLEQEAAMRVRPEQKAQVLFANIAGEKIMGTVESVYPKQGDFITRIKVTELALNILPGMTADVVIEVGSKKDVLLIPIKAISDGQVLRFRENKRKKIPVKLGHYDGEWAELVEGDILLTDEIIIKAK